MENPSPDESSTVYRLVKNSRICAIGFCQNDATNLRQSVRVLWILRCAGSRSCSYRTWPMCMPSKHLLPTNDLLLCAVHHKLFDAGLMSLNEWNVISAFSPKGMTYITKADDQYVLDLNGTLAHMPIDSSLCPSHEFLKYRSELVAQMFER